MKCMYYFNQVCLLVTSFNAKYHVVAVGKVNQHKPLNSCIKKKTQATELLKLWSTVPVSIFSP